MRDEDSQNSGHPRLTHKQAVAIALGDAAGSEADRSPLVVQRRQLYADNAGGVLKDLAAVGFSGLETVRELRMLGRRYAEAVPVLLSWLPRVRYLLLSEDIVRTLSVSFAKKLATPEFLRFFRQPPVVEDPLRPASSQPPKEHLRWVFGNGLGIFAGPPIAAELMDLALAREYGIARTEIVVSLPKTNDKRVPDVLLSLLDDPPVRTFAVQALGKMRYAPARPLIEEMLDDSDENMRDQAKKALKRPGW